MAVSDWSTDADLNVSIDGINIAEGCPPSNVNNALRAIMANVKDLMGTLAGDIADAISATSANFNRFFPQGCRMLFQQSAAPSGWTKVTDTAYDNVALRLVTGSVANRTSGKKFTTCMATGRASTNTAAGGTVGNTTLSVAQLARHSHTVANVPNTWRHMVDGDDAGFQGIQSFATKTSSTTGSSSAHNHSFSGASHGHRLDLDINFIDCIVAVRNA
jgi:hypothetical protein